MYLYYRYLNIYEKVNFLGVDPDSSRDDQEDGPARKKVCLPVESIPLTYNYNHHKIPGQSSAVMLLHIVVSWSSSCLAYSVCVNAHVLLC